MTRFIRRYEGATPGTQPRWAFHDRGDSLCVSGVTLTHITSFFRPLEGTQGLASVLRKGLSVMSKADKKRTRMSLTTFMAVAKNDAELIRGVRLAMWWDRLCTRFNVGEEWIVHSIVTDHSFRASNNLVEGILRDERLSVVCCETNSMCPGGPAFAAMGAQQGDTVALVSGVSFPLVLRPHGQQRFRLIGPLFLPGVMDGELKDVLTPDLFHDIMLV